MQYTTLAFALASILPSALASPIAAPAVAHTAKNDTMSIAAAPKFYSGPYTNFPKIGTWLSFEDMFNRNKDSMRSTGDTGEDVGRM